MSPLTRTLSLIALGLIAAYAWRLDGVKQGRAEERASRARIEERALVETVTVREVRYARDTVRLWREIARWDTARVTDTLVVTHNDTVRVYVPRDVADAAVSACLAVVRSCEGLREADGKVITNLREQLEANEAARPSFFKRWADRLLWLLAGYGLNELTGRD